MEKQIKKEQSMKRIVVLFCIAFCLVCFAFKIEAQEIKEFPYTNRWREFELDHTTTQDVEERLGSPHRTVTKNLKTHLVDKWLTNTRHEKVFKTYRYERVEDYKLLEFSFYDEKLVQIRVEYATARGKFPAQLVPDIFGVGFVIVERSIPDGTTPADYEGQRESTVPRVPPSGDYNMLAVTPDKFITVRVTTVFNGKVLARGILRRTIKEVFPGKVLKIVMLSRRFDTSLVNQRKTLVALSHK